MSRRSSEDAGEIYGDEAIAHLDSNTLNLIDEAFNNAVGWQPSGRPSKRRRLTRTSAKKTDDLTSQGGFLVEDVEMDEDSGGGFIPEIENDEVGEEPQSIPLSLVPSALDLLGLPSDDDEILGVFRNASSGWSSTPANGEVLETAGSVSRRDWRAVCAVLLPNGVPEQQDNTSNTGGDDDSEGNFELQADEESDLTEEEDYQPSPVRASTSRRKPKGKAKLEYSTSDEEEDGTAKTLSARQKRECRIAFALFFPDLDPDSAELSAKKLTIKDVARCAGFIKEKLSADDIIEMLRLFSSDPSNNPSVNLSDFERIMTATKLI